MYTHTHTHTHQSRYRYRYYCRHSDAHPILSIGRVTVSTWSRRALYMCINIYMYMYIHRHTITHICLY